MFPYLNKGKFPVKMQGGRDWSESWESPNLTLFMGIKHSLSPNGLAQVHPQYSCMSSFTCQQKSGSLVTEQPLISVV